MKAVLKEWNFIRPIRLVLVVAILILGIVAKETLTVILGVTFGGMALANIGCRGEHGREANTLAVNGREIEYEELDSKK